MQTRYAYQPVVREPAGIYPMGIYFNLNNKMVIRWIKYLFSYCKRRYGC